MKCRMFKCDYQSVGQDQLCDIHHEESINIALNRIEAGTRCTACRETFKDGEFFGHDCKPFLTPVIECPIETPYCPEKLNTNPLNKGIIFLGTCLIFPVISLFIALYMWVRHPGRCINEIKKMWSDKDEM